MMKIEMLLFLKNLIIAWILNETTCLWEAPVAMPTEQLENNQYYSWNESAIKLGKLINNYLKSELINCQATTNSIFPTPILIYLN
jgi:hypothetical protein